MDALHALAESLSHAHPNKPKTVDCWLLDIGTPKNSRMFLHISQHSTCSAHGKGDDRCLLRPRALEA